MDGEAAACLPLCATGGINDRELPAATYQTLWFFNGAMTIDLDTPWALSEDSTGEFSLGQVEDPDYRLVFWLDVYPVVEGARVEGIPNTATDLLGWVRSDPGPRRLRSASRRPSVRSPPPPSTSPSPRRR